MLPSLLLPGWRQPGLSDPCWTSAETHRSYNSLHLVHSEGDKIIILPFVLLKGFVSLFSVELGILKEIKEYGTVFGVG